MLGIPGDQPPSVRQMKIIKVETGGNRTSHQGKMAALRDPASKPGMRRNNILMQVAFHKIGAQPRAAQLARLPDLNDFKRLTRIKMPHLVGFDLVKCREVTLLQQKMYPRTDIARQQASFSTQVNINHLHTAVSLAIEPPFGMGLKIQFVDVGLNNLFHDRKAAKCVVSLPQRATAMKSPAHAQRSPCTQRITRINYLDAIPANTVYCAPAWLMLDMHGAANNRPNLKSLSGGIE